MQGTKLPITAFSVGISGQNGPQADELTQQLSFNLQKADEMAALAKIARHRVITFRPNYDRVIQQKESKTRRKIIDKKNNLEASRTAAICAFRYYAVATVAVANQLAALMAQLIAGGKHYDSTVPSYGRKANAILVARFIAQVPEILAKMEESFREDGNRGMDGSGDLITLFFNVDKHEESHRYKNDLYVPYIKGASREQHFLDLENLLDQLAVQEEGLARSLKVFFDAKARYFAGEWDTPLSSTAQAQGSVAKYDEAAVDYEVARWSLENAQGSLWNVLCQVKEAFRRAHAEAYRASRNETDRHNIIAIKCKLLQTEDSFRFSQRQLQDKSDRKDGNHQREIRERNSRQALEEAFRNIPAQLAISSLPFLP
ncbi:MAG: hypothetical protein K2Y39_05795 [Candidatus Obscuribacterales bacterium]|nr:hypothetical protein [Candidatus Obscuribacterales bacterium]